MSDIPWMYATFGSCQRLVWYMCSHKSHLSRLFLLLLRMSSGSGMNSRGREIGRRLFLINLPSGMVLVQPRVWDEPSVIFIVHRPMQHLVRVLSSCKLAYCMTPTTKWVYYFQRSILMWVLKSNNLTYLFSRRNKQNSSNSWTHLMFHTSMFDFVRYVEQNDVVSPTD